MGRLSTTECTYLPTYFWVVRKVESFRFMCAQTFRNKLGRCSPSSFLKAFLVTSSFLLLFSRFFMPGTASRPQ